ncbi:MAG TPA: TolC family protein [Nitrospirae bacterium]|nr:TolC family protein [Nitrospirota bacterium]
METLILIVRGGAGVALALLLLIAQGCASYDSNDRFATLAKTIETEGAGNGDVDIKKVDVNDRLDQIDRIDIKTAIRIALDNNPSLMAIREKVNEAMGKYPIVTALDDPTIGVGLYPSTIASNATGLRYKFDYRQPIPYPGKLHLKGERALAEADAMFSDFGYAKLELIRLVKTAYLELWFTRAAIDINNEDKKLLKEFKTIAAGRYSAGKGALQDVIHADLDLAKVEHKQIVLKRTLNIATARLNVLLGRAARLSLPAPSGLPEVTPLPDKEAMIKRALSHNPAIGAAISRITAAKASLKLARSQSYPDFAVSGSYNRAWMSEDLRPFIGISLNVPIQFGRLRAEKNIALAKLNRSKSILKAMEDQVRFKVEEPAQKIEEFHHAGKLFREAIIPESELNLDAARAGYSSGKNDFLTLIMAERGLIDSRLKYKRIMVDLRIWEAKLISATGESDE